MRSISEGETNGSPRGGNRELTGWAEIQFPC